MLSNLCAWYSGSSRPSKIRQLESLSDPFDGEQDPWRPQKRVWCSKQATWCSAEETGRNIRRCLCACKNLLGLPYHSVECERSFSVLLSQLTHNRLQSRLNHELILVAHSARPVDMDDVHYHASQKYTTFTAIRFITFTVSHIHTVTEPLTHCQSREFGFAPNFIKQMFAHPGLKPCRCPWHAVNKIPFAQLTGDNSYRDVTLGLMLYTSSRRSGGGGTGHGTGCAWCVGIVCHQQILPVLWG